MSAAGSRLAKVLVWDVPTRLFHWLLVLSFAGAFATADSERHRDLHVTFGATILALIAFRLLWGVCGTRYARFGSFAFGPRAVARDLASLARRFPWPLLRGWGQPTRLGPTSPVRHVGHTPAGSWAIWLMLGLGVLVGATGAATYNEVSGKWLEDVHAALAWVLLASVGVHVAGVLLSSALHRENLVAAMITGRKRGDGSEGIRRSRWVVGALLAAMVVALWLDMVSIPGAARDVAKLAQEPATRAAHAEDD